MEKRKLGNTDLAIMPLIFGGNVFGWTADKAMSFALLDAFFEAGFNAIDTADVYCRFVPGKEGGESETIIGEWMKDRGVRDQIVLITKGGMDMGEGKFGLGKAYVSQACEASLKRLQTDYIDLYMAHQPDPNTPIGETLEGFQALIDSGKVRYASCSNYTAEQLTEALNAAGGGCARFEVLQPHYNLIERSAYEGALESLCLKENLGVIPYFALAAGFLTGKYRSKKDLRENMRSSMVAGYLEPRGLSLLDTLDTVAQKHSATPAQIALAWLMARPSITAPIASATNPDQLGSLLKVPEITLDQDDITRLNNLA
ncbi:MAG: aldo/keto reductase [Novosphingobium sp.]|nr:aldo/keto reductase [Novosphingobium sp.]